MAYKRRALDVSVLKVYSTKGDKESKYGQTELRLVVYDSKYCRLEKRQHGTFIDDEGNEKQYSKMKGLDLFDLETIATNLDAIRQSMRQFEASKQGRGLED